MPKIILMRRDNQPQINKQSFTEYTVPPAFHLNLNGNRQWDNTGYTSTFEYDPRKPNPNYNMKPSGSVAIEQYSGSYIHFILLDSNDYKGNIELNGGTSGIVEGIIQTVNGTVWETPTFNSTQPQLFDTQSVAVELGANTHRDAYEILLGGNWQQCALSMTYSSSQGLDILNSKPSIDELTKLIELAVAAELKKAKENADEIFNEIKSSMEIRIREISSISSSAEECPAMLQNDYFQKYRDKIEQARTKHELEELSNIAASHFDDLSQFIDSKNSYREIDKIAHAILSTLPESCPLNDEPFINLEENERNRERKLDQQSKRNFQDRHFSKEDSKNSVNDSHLMIKFPSSRVHKMIALKLKDNVLI